MRYAVVLALSCACSKSVSSSEPAAPTSTADAGGEQLDVPSPATPGIGPLVPYVPASAWRGQGVPPKQFSLFTVPERSPVLSYAALDRDACEETLKKRNVPFERAEDIQGVRAPIRLTGPLHGVDIHSPQRGKSRANVVDCRLALSLDDFAATLAARDIVEMVQISAYRSKNEGGCTVKYPGEQHCAALAVDVSTFVKKDGTKLVVERDFKGRIGTLTCAETPKNELWEIACNAAGKQFQVVLTPNWNAEHKNHLHLELTVHEWVLAR